MKVAISALLSVFFIYTPVYCDIKPPQINPGILAQSKSIGDCQACRIFANSFKNGLERTARGKYEGGDTAWEEEKLKKSYKRSEIRLIDIQEGLCREEPKFEVYCHNIAEKAEDFVEQWWAQDPDDSGDFFTFICIENMKLCCPEHHFGKDCALCVFNLGSVCSGNGKCRGEGTRKGNGTCLCNSGYTGEKCENCAIGYYLSDKDDNKLVCSPCHKSCLDHCRGGTPRDCVTCKPGYMYDTEEGCTDINECDEGNKCKEQQFCANGQGSYACLACDKSCDRCYGDGPDMCRKCAKGYSKKGEFCAPEREDEDESDYLTTSRYITKS